MTFKSIITAAVGICLTVNTYAQQNDKQKEAPAHIGLIYPLSTNGVNAINYTNDFSLHAIAGVSGGEKALCLSGFASFVKNDANGLIASGFANAVLGDADGAQLAGFMNMIGGESRGLQASGFMSFAGYNTGVQLGGFANLTLQHAQGLQAAGFMNIAKTVAGAQVAGFMNVASDVDGAQVSGFMNVGRDVDAQASPFLNVAREVSGVQLSGFINVAEKSDYPIGFINIIRKGEMGIGMTVDNNLTNMISFRSGGRVLYGIVGIGANLRDTDDEIGAVEFGLGAHLNISKRFRINFEGVSTCLSDFDDDAEYNSAIRVLPALKFNHLELFAGPTFNYFAHSNNYTSSVVESYAWGSNEWGYVNGFYFGGIAGVQFIF